MQYISCRRTLVAIIGASNPQQQIYVVQRSIDSAKKHHYLVNQQAQHNTHDSLSTHNYLSRDTFSLEIPLAR